MPGSNEDNLKNRQAGTHYEPACLLTIVATKFPDLPTNVSPNTQGALDELSLDVSNDMNQSDGNVELWALSPN
ncbi:hypothetical protein DSO57_1014281 [Entomophthora muscae]|uniref:Uncharacterized protein n=1 Tax=Entomophthora muscae TaxID=34485 RepID=A0ACC2S7H8_9FUNG|nr:hypothetical protein DSO57_1014281 [Entomophthora muscae]